MLAFIWMDFDHKSSDVKSRVICRLMLVLQVDMPVDDHTKAFTLC